MLQRVRGLVAFFLLWGAASAGMSAQGGYTPLGATAGEKPSYLAKAGLEQRLGQSLPMDVHFTDETGLTAPLQHWFNNKPTVMALVYYRCAMLCPQVLHGLAAGLHQATLQAGKDYNVLVFSIDPEDTPHDATAQKMQFVHDAGINAQDAAAVHFLTAQAPAIQAVTEATGFHYVRVPGPDGRMDQFAHSSVIIFATPDGHLSKYLSGIDYPARDLRLALLGASEHKISNPVDLLILYCCSYNPAAGRYSVSVLRVLSIAAMFAVAGLVTMLVLLTRKPKSPAAA